MPLDSAANLLPYRHGIYGEALGNGVYGSLNYERFFRVPIGNDLAAFRVGALVWPKSQTAIVPLELFWLSEKPWRIGKGNLRGEFGTGLTFVKSEYVEYRNQGVFANMTFLPTLRMACRWQLPDNRLFVKAGISGVIIPVPGYVPFMIIPLPSLGVGYSLGQKLLK
ncbi:hypothetical protein [Adhaeribacter terreus]|uniref:Uncharacterized protein n=1 Tax=Adhaeribacter terreus TaxID=529703 RepID=A0ABW0E8W5_9BACT